MINRLLRHLKRRSRPMHHGGLVKGPITIRLEHELVIPIDLIQRELIRRQRRNGGLGLW